MAKLVVHLPNGSMRDVVLDCDRITIGRRADNDVCLPYPAVSAEHAEIITVGADSFLHDLGSTNGTLVNGNRVAKHFLRDHDRIDVGRVQLVYLTNDAEVMEPLAPEILGAELRGLTQAMPAATHSAVSVGAPDAERADEPTAEQLAGAKLAPVDELLDDLMEMHSDASVAIDMPPTISMVPTSHRERNPFDSKHADATSGVFIEVMNGPNAGQITRMTKAEFVFGKSGRTLAVIHRDDVGFFLVRVDANATVSLNGRPVPHDGRRLAFGDTMEVAGVKLRFDRRAPL